MTVHLSNRLQGIASMVTPGSAAVDVGCDHGYLSVYLVDRGICPAAIASDVRVGPLDHARETVKQYGHESDIACFLADGVPGHIKETFVQMGVGEDVPRTLIIAGMGGLLIKSILSRIPEGSDFKEWVLSPQSDLAAVRRSLIGFSMKITDEDMILESGKFYQIIKCKKVPGDELVPMTESEYEYGPVLIRKGTEIFHSYLDFRKDVLTKIKTGLEESGLTQSSRYAEVLELIKLNEDARSFRLKPEEQNI